MKFIATLIATSIAIVIAAGCSSKRGDNPPPNKRTDGGPSGELVALRKELTDEVARQQPALEEQMKKGDEKLEAVIANTEKLGLNPTELANLKKELEATKQSTGRSPGAEGAATAQKRATDKVAGALDRAEKDPTPKNVDDVKQALDELKKTGPQQREEGEKKGEESAAIKVLKALGPLAAGAACMYFGGDPGTCAAVAKLVGDVLRMIFKDPEAGDPEKAAQVIQDGAAMLSGDCDRTCIETKTREWGLDTDTIKALIDKGLSSAGITNEDVKKALEQAKDVAMTVQQGIDCVNKVKAQPTVETLRASCQMLYRNLPEAAKKGLDCFDGKNPDGSTFEKSEAWRVGTCLLVTVGKH